MIYYLELYYNKRNNNNLSYLNISGTNHWHHGNHVAAWQPSVNQNRLVGSSYRPVTPAAPVHRECSSSKLWEEMMQKSEAAAGGTQRGQRMIFTGKEKKGWREYTYIPCEHNRVQV